MKFSYSRVSCYESCAFMYALRYIAGLKTLPNTDANNALYLGTAVHTGIETTVEKAIRQYFDNYPVVDDLQINEAIKIEDVVQKAKPLLPDGTYELKIEDNEFIGFMDLLVPKGNNHFALYDFKYSNNIDRYLESGQLHVYKHYYEKTNPGHVIDEMYYVFLPKIMIRQKKTEDLYQFRVRLREELSKAEVKIIQVDFDESKVGEYHKAVEEIKTAVEFPKKESRLCAFCQFQSYCQKGETWELL